MQDSLRDWNQRRAAVIKRVGDYIVSRNLGPHAGQPNISFCTAIAEMANNRHKLVVISTFFMCFLHSNFASRRQSRSRRRALRRAPPPHNNNAIDDGSGIISASSNRLRHRWYSAEADPVNDDLLGSDRNVVPKSGVRMRARCVEQRTGRDFSGRSVHYQLVSPGHLGLVVLVSDQVEGGRRLRMLLESINSTRYTGGPPGGGLTSSVCSRSQTPCLSTGRNRSDRRLQPKCGYRPFARDGPPPGRCPETEL